MRTGHTPKNPGKRKRIIVTAGPTREMLDPVRYISNCSTGLAGYEIAGEFRKKGFSVCLITGPVCLKAPIGVEVIKVLTAREMKKRVDEKIKKADCIVMTAAVSDFRPVRRYLRKIKRGSSLTVRLIKNPDILGDIEKRPGLVKVGFSVETDDPIRRGTEKLKTKGLDEIIINSVDAGQNPFGPGRKTFFIVDRRGRVQKLKNKTKRDLAGTIVKDVTELTNGKTNRK